ncbi:S8 family serine peptidase [Halobaculum sp. MBLA0143]|uniref:S8 family serine peptidase n=1 Tax=Halobaculum sp. MBLA0143 TaxID=3079933 RepID=UPI00352639AD
MTDDDGLSRRGFLRATGAAAAATTVAGPAAGQEPSASRADRVLVGVSAAADSLRGPVAETMPESAAIRSVDDTLRYVTVQFPPDTPTAIEHDYVQTAEAHDMVRYAERNKLRTRRLTPDDPLRSEQESLDLINANAAFDTTVGSSDVRIAVIDTGADYEHEDLAANVRANPGRDFVFGGDSDPINGTNNGQPQPHGTHVGGIAAAVTDNETGVTGVSQSELIFGRALGDSGAGFTEDIADAIRWAGDQNADIINLSLGASTASNVELSAVQYAHRKGALLVAAAGNDGREAVSFPAGYDLVVAVAAADSDGTLASFTNTGEQVEVVAPGVDYLSTVPDGYKGKKYTGFSGTSMASPCAAGVAALIMAQHGTDRTETRRHLRASSEVTTPVGIVDAQAAVEEDPGDIPVPPRPSGGLRQRTDSVTSRLSGFDDSDCYRYGFSFDNPSAVDVELSGEDGTDFDLYVNDGVANCPTNDTATKRFVSTDSNESLTVQNPDVSVPLYVTVDSYAGSGRYTLEIVETG